jgi:hypothetical protein
MASRRGEADGVIDMLECVPERLQGMDGGAPGSGIVQTMSRSLVCFGIKGEGVRGMHQDVGSRGVQKSGGGVPHSRQN